MNKKSQGIIVNFFSDLINEIDIQTEKVLLNLQQDEIESINSLRETYINRVHELEKFNLERLTDNCEIKCCFFLPNIEMEITKKNLGSFNFMYTNKLGILVTVVAYDMFDTLCLIKNLVLNNKPIKGKNFRNFQEYAKVEACMTLIEKKSSNPFIDLSIPENNIIKYFSIRSLQDIGEYDLNFLPRFINVNELESFHLNHDGLDSIPSEIFENFKSITSLHLSCHNIERFSTCNFYDLSNLTHLEMFCTGLHKIENNAFEGLKNLKDLNLNENNIERINPETFYGLENLESLCLDQNSIEVIQKDTFIHLKNLKELRMNMNKINKLKAKCFNGLKNLTDLRMNSNSMKLHADVTSFDACVNVQVLDLDSNNFVNHDPVMFQKLTNVKFLNLRASQLKQVEMLHNFLKLEVLDMAETKLTIEQLDSVNFDNLKYLLCSFEKVPKFGENFKNLQALSLEDVVCFEKDCFKNLKNLEFMRLDVKYAEIIETINKNNFLFSNNFKYFKLKTSKRCPQWFEMYERKKHLFFNMFDSKREIDFKETDGCIRIRDKDCKSYSNYFEKFLKASPNVIEAIFCCFYI